MSKMPLTRNQTSAAAQSKSGGAESSETSTAKDGAKQGSTSSESDPPRRDSPDNCSICLGPFIDKSFTNSCAHSFCFVCLKQWSKVKAECPLCKQPFCRIFHNIRSSQMYDTYELPRQPPNQVNQYNFLDYVRGGLTTFAGPTHHYLSLSQPFDADLTLSNFSRFQFRHRRYDRYLNPMSVQGEHPYSYSGPAVNPTTHVCAANWPRGPEDFRREVYRHNLGPPAVILGNENSTYRLTPAMVAASSHRLHRIRPWLTRELRVLLRNDQNVRLAMSMIQPLLTQVSVDSVYFHDRVATLIGRRSRVFIQEFLAFANSALSMQAFDRKAMYHRRDESVAPSSPSSTSSENDVVEVTDVSPDSGVVSTFAGTQTSSSLPLDLRRSGWDSPTPGPSWSSLNNRDPSAQAVPIDRVSVSSESDDPVFIPHLRDSDSPHSRAGSDIIFVKYDKPWEDRSPINLTSESEKEKEAEADRSKKKKKSKHKKRRKQSFEKNESVKKDKSHKSSKGKSSSKEKSKSSSKGESGEERTGNAHKRHHSLSSPDARRAKKRKKSKEKRDKSSELNTDRELVDRFFAEAFANQKVHVSTSEEKGDSPRSGKDKEKSNRPTGKDKSKKKKKSKSRSRDSRSPSFSHSFKKHHSGHKKSSNAARLSQSSTGERNHTHHRASSAEEDKGPIPSGRPQHRDSSHNTERDAVSQPHSSNSISHTVTSGFQPPYLPLPETVQHIPVNLWVSTWPALPVSHTYHAPHPHAPSANVPGTSHSVPQSSSSTFPPAASPRIGQEPCNAALDSHTISSESSTEYDSDDAPERQIPSLKNVDSRTMHWLETHCPDLGRLQPSSPPLTEAHNNSTSSTSDMSSSSSSDSSVSNAVQQPQPLETTVLPVERDIEDVNVEVVSIESGEEDIVICSSTSDSDSDVHCVEEDSTPVQKHLTASSCKEADLVPSTSSTTADMSMTNMATIPFLPDFDNSTLVETSSKNSLFLPSGSKTFQPFKLPKKSALTHQGKDPFFPSMSHSSDEEGETAHISDSLHPQKSQPMEANSFPPQTSSNSSVPLAKPASAIGLDLIKDTVVTSIPDSNEEQNFQKYAEGNKIPITEGGEQWNRNINTTEPVNVPTSGTVQINFPQSTFSHPSSSMYQALSSLPQSTPSGTNLNYLPYSPLPAPPATVLPFPQPLPFSIPPSGVTGAQTPSLAVHFPFNPLTPVLTQSQTPNFIPPLYPSVNQTSSHTTFTLAQQVTACGDNGSSLPSQSQSNSSVGEVLATLRDESGPDKSCSLSQSEASAGDGLQHIDPGQAIGSENGKSNLFSEEAAVISNQHVRPNFTVSEKTDLCQQQEESDEQISSTIPVSSYCSSKSDIPATHDYLEPEGIISSNSVKPDKSPAHVLETNYHNLLTSINSIIDKNSDLTDERSAISATSSSDSKETESAHNLLFDANNERKSSSPVPFDDSECNQNANVSESES